ncbi:hypothetical protein CRYUN_Cryun08bG0117600 [Craigia yunnanensis]
MRQHLQDLRTVGRQLEESGVLNKSLRSRSNSWGLHMPLVCPDGAVVAYAWKRQLAGQAGASAVDRTSLGFRKCYREVKDPVLVFSGSVMDGQGTDSVSKKHRNLQALAEDNQDNLSNCKTLSNVLNSLEKDMPSLKVLTYERLDWLKRASSLRASANDNTMEAPKHNFHITIILRPAPQNVVAMDKVAVIELLFPSVFIAVASLHPAGSIDPDSAAFFSPDEGGSYIHSRGSSVYHIYRHITEHAAVALQYFLGLSSETALHSLLHWICSYQTLFTKVCRKCGRLPAIDRRLLAMDRQSALLLPPVHRPYQTFSTSKISSTQLISSTRDQSSNAPEAYHIGCFSDEA